MFKRDKSIIVFIALILYRIPLSHIIGDNGMGYLSGPMEVFLGLTLLLGSGLTITMQGMIRDRFKRDQFRNAGQVFRYGRRYAVICAILMMAANLAGFSFVSTKVLADGGQRLAYLGVGPAVALAIIISLIKGYLAGTENSAVVVIGEIFEAVTIGVCMIIGGIWGQKYGSGIAALLRTEDVSAMYGALGTMVGLVCAEFITVILFTVMAIFYRRSFMHLMKSDSSRRVEYASDVSSKLIGGMVEDGLLNMLIQLPILILLIMFRRNGINTEADNVNSMVGVFYAKYLGIVGVLSGLAVLPVSNGVRGIIAANFEGEEQLAAERFNRVFARVLYFAIPATIFVTVLTPVILKTVFTGMITTATTVLYEGTSLVILYALTYMFMSILNRLSYNKEVIFLTALSLIATSVLGFFLLYKGGKGLPFVGILLMIYFAIDVILCLILIIRNMRIRLFIVQQLVLPVIVSGIIALAIKLLSGVLINYIGGILTLVVCIIPAWILYNIACIFLRCVSASQMDKKFLGGMFVAIGQNMGIY